MVRGLTRTQLAAVLVIAVLVVPATAAATLVFSDVDDGDVHAAGIEWIAEANVTSGCGAGRFCPNDPVTRAQMGTFLHRLSGDAPGIVPSVNADRLDGRHSTALGGAAAAFTWTTGAVSSTTPAALHAFSVAVPADGWMLVTVAGQLGHDHDAAGTGSATGSFTLGLCDSSGSFAACGETARSYTTQDADNVSGLDPTSSITKTRLVAVAAGQDLTMWINASVGGAGQALTVLDLYATALFVPFQLSA